MTTPITESAVTPDIRTGGFSADLLPACIVPDGHPGLTARLQAGNLLVVTTGQQPALFLGPLYTVHKALTAVALARILEARWSRPVQPIFWIASDDHDFAEANHASWPAQDGGIATFTLRERPQEAPLTPMYREPVGPEIAAGLDRLEAELPGSDFKPEVMAWLRRHYRPNATVGSSFGQALAELLAPHGVVCLDSSHSAIKHRAAPLLIRALEQADALDRALDARARELIALGRDPRVPVGDGATLVMIEASLGRDRLIRTGTGFATRRSGEAFTLDQLRVIARSEPERLSPNVLLRPVIEAALLPTTAYVGGPGELRYLPLTTPIYQALGVPRQQPMPRWSGILVEPRVDRVLEKFHATLDDLLEPGARLEARVIQDQLPPAAVAALNALRNALRDAYTALESAAIAIDPTLEKPVQNARQHGLSEADGIEKRLVQHLKRRQETELTQIARARTAVQPEGKPQERVYSIAGYLARYGPGVLDLVQEMAAQWYAAILETSRATA